VTLLRQVSNSEEKPEKGSPRRKQDA